MRTRTSALHYGINTYGGIGARNHIDRNIFNARLSHDGWMSCHSCHAEGHTSGLVVDTLGDGDYGAPKLVPSLLGTRDTQPWGWNGSVALFREQIQKSITTTMHGEPLTVREMEDFAAYLSSLNAPPPPDELDPKLIQAGQTVFHSLGCVDCHAPPAYTTPVTVDVSQCTEHHHRSDSSRRWDLRSLG